MKRLEGMPISPGYAHGIAVVYDYEIERRLETPSRSISNLEVHSERSRLDDALERSGDDLKSVEQSARSEPRLADSAALLSAHAAMAKEIAAIVRQHIGRELVNAEEALDTVIREFVVRFARLEGTYFRAREQDVRDVGRRLMGHLLGSTSWINEPLPPGSIIVARELLPSETVELAKSGVIAIVAEYGGTFSHTAIVARSLGIPAVTGIADVTSHVRPGMRLLVDGESGSVVLTPSEAEEASFVDREREYGIRIAATATEEELPCVTRDGIEISLLGNISLPAEVEGVSKHNLAGAGLFRTEFLFLESHQRPSLEKQSEIYNEVARRLGELPLVIRTFDLGGDKLPPFLLSEGSDIHANLHLRGLRFSLNEVRLLETQLTAILHVAQTADVRILFPMVVGSDDFARAIATVERVADRVGFLRRPPIGAMLETPAALYALDEIIELADFVAIGTNDLTQYMLAADRDLAEGTDDCTATHPAVLRALRQIIEAAEQRQCPVSVCGEEAADPSFACLLVGLGIRELSLTPTRAAAVRQVLRGISCVDAGEVADLALQCRTPQQVRELLQHLLSAEARVSRQTGQPSEPSAVTLSGAPVATRLSGEADLAAISVAHKVQRTLFPSSAPCLPGFDIAGAVHPAERASGDFFDYFPLGQGSLGVLVANVSGHESEPTLLMAQTQAYLRALAETGADPGELLAGANRLFATSDPGHSVTMFLGRLDVATRSLSYVAAAHQGYLIANDGEVRVLRSHSIPLGAKKTMTPCPASRIAFKAGDILVVPTDGAEEAMSVGGRQFGRKRLCDLVRSNKDKPAVDIVEALFEAARDFAGQRPQEDGITALIVKVLPPASARSNQPEGCG